MPRKLDTYWKEFLPLWGKRILSWYSIQNWKQLMTSLFSTVAIIWMYIYFNEIDIALNNATQLLFAVLSGLLWLLFVTIVSYMVANIELYKKQKSKITSLSKIVRGNKLWTEPNIILETKVSDDYSDGIFYWNARLIVTNNEDVDLTDCYATLIYAADYLEEQQREMQDPKIKKDRIRWSKSGYSNDNCEITIPLTDSREVNLVHTKRNFEYLLCGKTIPANTILGTRLYIVKIRLDGKYNGKAIKPQFFDGYIYYDGTRLRHYKFDDTRNSVIIESGEGNLLDPYMIFKEGDWTQDDRIPIPRPNKNKVKNEKQSKQKEQEKRES